MEFGVPPPDAEHVDRAVLSLPGDGEVGDVDPRRQVADGPIGQPTEERGGGLHADEQVVGQRERLVAEAAVIEGRCPRFGKPDDDPVGDQPQIGDPLQEGEVPQAEADEDRHVVVRPGRTSVVAESQGPGDGGHAVLVVPGLADEAAGRPAGLDPDVGRGAVDGDDVGIGALGQDVLGLEERHVPGLTAEAVGTATLAHDQHSALGHGQAPPGMGITVVATGPNRDRDDQPRATVTDGSGLTWCVRRLSAAGGLRPGGPAPGRRAGPTVGTGGSGRMWRSGRG